MKVRGVLGTEIVGRVGDQIRTTAPSKATSKDDGAPGMRCSVARVPQLEVNLCLWTSAITKYARTFIENVKAILAVSQPGATEATKRRENTAGLEGV
jgi:hypothetical protein